MTDPLSHFAALGVNNAAAQAIKEASALVRKTYPKDDGITVISGVQAAFTQLNYSNVVITPESLAAKYPECQKQNKQVEQLVLTVIKKAGVVGGEHFNIYRITQFIDFSKIQPDEINAAISRLTQKGRLKAGQHQGFLRLAHQGHQAL